MYPRVRGAHTLPAHQLSQLQQLRNTFWALTTATTTRAEPTDFAALEKIQQQLYIEVEGVAPGDSLTGFTQDDGAQQTALNGISNVPQLILCVPVVRPFASALQQTSTRHLVVSSDLLSAFGSPPNEKQLSGIR
ncbi:hypothetical protein GBF38_001663 [Nibea albiflora]|uniref:Uncharacterized protein n=1 Tax=Nibea albiflora TaxID=240163 RepID=A0ACB7EU10_NIBAL|nr:hypothetical protein GBF38_001663 [Nibea albiflora]